MRLVTFPGQGSPVLTQVLKKYIAQRSPAILASKDARLAMGLMERSPADPASIAACSFLLYQLLPADKTNQVFLGHSLGELSCLAAGNRLFSLTQTMQVATYRNKLMIEAAGGQEYGLWALSAPKALDLARDVKRLLPAATTGTSLALANVNTLQQCVVTGSPADFAPWESELRRHIGRCRIKSLENPYGIPFHNHHVLAKIREPLLDFMWQNLKSQGTNTQDKLDYPIISNLTGQLVCAVPEALENFARSSCNVVEFVKCCESVNLLNLHEAINVGPGAVISKLVIKNCHTISNNLEWNEYMGDAQTSSIKAE
ncbi:LANO_0H14906g1_1 [Lachancea nothofagi CBS 11611]|uniref:[acyl-carrier-protein] S-malonyltransferase n=1 Tax=Lachancea nothofagi CBS 11611 TaxID=1266666 RepID=A0A1G4KMQ4_9SACH|nr:LANO_0H14906g1_1 [Lachancea nothofagi CBS 11611]